MLMPPQPPRGMKYAPGYVIVRTWLWDGLIQSAFVGLEATVAGDAFHTGEYRTALLAALVAVYIGLGVYQIIQRTQRLTMEIINGRGPWYR